MLTLVSGRIAGFVTLILLFVTVGSLMRLAKKGRLHINVRKIAGLEAIGEAVSRATETGRPVHCTPGGGELGLSSPVGPMLVAGLSIIGYVARQTAKLNAGLVISIAQGDVLPLADEMVRQGYLAEGKTEIPSGTIRFFPSGYSYTSGVCGLIRRERVAANIMVGPFYHEAVMFAETAFQVGAITVSGTARLNQVPFLVACSDYVLIGEEVYAAGAYLSRDPVQLASLAGQDVGKIASMVLTAAVAILATLNIDWLLRMLKT